ncbi:mercuric transporter MerT family protein [Noviherbaspirillum sp. UKPF54]|uniref:mercuric transporter MerT family protein n=1 Tax=Noviherbaspirillum sp. UKPF54 TaxID=2601898 RepID=UPI0011B1BFEF|nr:mercuric transporter MerT family protein [Noviherbaspirillum sp. UKPF54]QDZ27890.1 mercuric transport protein [Noviherbaspirillum sp. UKPF54]
MPEKLQFMKSSETSSRKNLSARLMAVGVVSALIASSCCVLPLVLVLAGITGAWMTTLTSLRPVTPVFTVLALLALGWAGVLLFRPAGSCSVADGGACETTRPVARLVFLGCAAFVGLLLLFPLLAPIFY